MKARPWLKRITMLPLACSLFAAGIGTPHVLAADPSPLSGSNGGRWLAGEYHMHTYQSDDAQESLENVLEHAFDENQLDWVALSDHLRMESRDDTGAAIPGGSIPLSKGIAQYQVPKIEQLLASGKFKDKIIFTGFEWDMPGYDHSGVGILTDHPESEEALKAISHFEYLFTNRSASYYDQADVGVWNAQDSRAYSTKQDARTAIAWLKKNYPESYVLFNHPSRKRGTTSEIKIEDIRDFNNIAPHIAFGFEGMPGNQMSPDRGETTQIYGGADILLAKVGGVWDALLGEGRRFWNFANSDFHFNISKDRKYSSGYWPGQYSKNYTWVNGSDMKAVVDGMRSGKSFSVYGDLINALDFHITGAQQSVEMGDDLQVTQGDDLTLTIRFKSPEQNHNGEHVQVDHVDLIAGDVTGPVEPGTPAYTKDTNDSTKVIKRFTSNEWTIDAEGYNVITYKLGAAEKNQYFRLRGTNLGTDVPGETSNGEPLIDPKNITADNETRFTEINSRNYSDMWFYSNPIFVNVTPYSDEQAVNDTSGSLNLGNTDLVTDDLVLPTAGEHGTSIQWSSSKPELVTNDGKLLVRYPQDDTPVKLTAVISRGSSSVTKTFDMKVKGLSGIATPELHSLMKTGDGQPYTAGNWTNQTVTVSVYTSVYTEPVTSVALELSLDGGEYRHYIADEKVPVTEEGKHTLDFRATDNLNRPSSLKLPVYIDRTPPVITLKGTSTVMLTIGSPYTEPGANAVDNIGLQGNVSVSGTVNTSTPGTYTIRYNVRDLAGNPAQEVIRTVYVRDIGSGGSWTDNTGGQISGGSISQSSSKGNDEGQKNQSSTTQLDVPIGQQVHGGMAGVVSLDIPTGLWRSDGQIDIKVLNAEDKPPAGSLVSAGQIVQLTSSTGNNFETLVGLTLHYRSEQIQPGSVPAVYSYNKQLGKWIFIGGRSGGDGTVSISTNHLGTFMVGSYKPITFADLNGHWAEPFASRLIGMNAIQGFNDQTFRPNEQMNRTQFTKLLADAFSLQSKTGSLPFSDAAKIPAWAKSQAAAVYEAGILSGHGWNNQLSFRGDQPLTRAELAVMLVKAINVNASDLPSSAEGDNFRDEASIPGWALSAAKAAAAAGLLTGYKDSTFRPDEIVTRAEAAAAIYRLLEVLHI